jgi:hypothetical protein
MGKRVDSGAARASEAQGGDVRDSILRACDHF